MARLLKSELERWHQLQLQRLELARRAKDLKALIEPLEEKFFSYVEENGGDERAVRSSGFLLKLNLKRENVSWKDEFVRVAGPDQAEALIAAAPSKDVLVIEPPPTPEPAAA